MNSRNRFDLTDDELDDLRYVKRKTLRWGAVLLVAVIILGVGGTVWNQFFRRTIAPIEGRTAQIEATQGNADFRIAAYDAFFDLCASIQAAEDVIENQEAELLTASGDRIDQINGNLVAQNNRRDTLVREYNQDVRKEATSGQFRASGLPAYIDPDNNNTDCGE
jgi:hypothetical protein